MNNYLIPANTKKSQYILGCLWSFAMILIVKEANLFVLIICMLPAFISAFLVMPVPNYHNVLQVLTNIFNFYTNRRKYYWRGWCVYERFGSSDKQ